MSLDSENNVMKREHEFDEKGRPSLHDWIAEGLDPKDYPTGYDNRKLGELTIRQRQELANFHMKASKRHQEQADKYNPPAKIGQL